MCGITGFLATSSESATDPNQLVCQMANQLAHRGPDDLGVWIDRRASVALGHRRLSILDLSPEGRQPMESRSGRYVIVFNGEIYNFGDLREELEAIGHAFRGHSDTEVVLAALDQWGIEDSLTRFNGMFAFGIWDRKEQELHLVRDRLGEKPLYYGWAGKTFLFASELKALTVHPDFHGEIDRNALALYLRYSCIPAPYTIYQGIRKLPPAARLTVRASDAGNLQEPVPYWSANEALARGIQDPFPGSDEEAIDSLDELLRDAVKIRMISDVPLGAFLSGGVDSSTIVALMQAQSERPVKTFSIGFYENAYDEAKYAAAVAHHLGAEHTEFYVSPEDIIPTIPLLPEIYDEPFSDSSQVPTYLVSRLTRNHVTVSLSGDGGDEIFGGYKRYFLWGRVWDKARLIPPLGRKGISRILRSLRPEEWNYFERVACFLGGNREHEGLLGDRAHRLAEILSAKDSFSRYKSIVSVCDSPNDIVREGGEPRSSLRTVCQEAVISEFGQQMMLFDSVSYLPDDILAKVDRASMAVSLEARAPFLDHRIFEFAARLPFVMKVRKSQGKWILRRVEERYLPKELVERPKKGFSLPIGEWLRSSLREWAEGLLNERRLKSEGYFHVDAVRQLWKQHISKRRDVQHHVWAILMFQAWLEKWGKHANREAQVPETRTGRGELAVGV